MRSSSRAGAFIISMLAATALTPVRAADMTSAGASARTRANSIRQIGEMASVGTSDGGTVRATVN